VKAVDIGDPRLPALFDPAGPNAPMVFAALDGRVPGRALADDLENPSMAVVQTREGFAAFSKDTSLAFLDAALARLRADSMVGIVWRDDGRNGVPEPPTKRVERLEFACLPPTGAALAALRASLPTDVSVARLTRDLLERCEWREVVSNAAGSIDDFLRTGVGLCLVLGDEIVAEAYAPYIGRGSAEVGVFTPEARRGRGYAALAVSFLSAALAERGLAMYWSCDADNASSIRVAEKLGFEQPQRFELLLYRPF
jgi:RimJ/RimL family protein N-acetyltransferase